MLKLFYKIKMLFNKVGELFYLGSTDKLPPPLSKEEEEYYVNMASDGDEHARDKLIEHNLRLVVFLAKKYENTRVDLEDLVSIGTIGLIKGIKTFSSDKNIRLATYASRCIDNEILMYLRSTKKLNSEVYLNEPIGKDKDDNVVTLQEVLENDERNIEDLVDLKFKVKELISLILNLIRGKLLII